jgi:hypothetical protein
VYNGTTNDAFQLNYTGSGNNIFDFQADSASILTLDKAGTLTLVGALATTSYSGTTLSGTDVVATGSLTMPSDNNPTTDAEGEIAWDANDDGLEVYDGAVSKIISSIDDGDALIFAPDGVNDEIAIFHVDADKYPFGIKLINVQITLPADAAYSMVFEEWAGDPPVAQNDIETVTTGAGDSYMEITTTGIDDSDIDADDYIFLHVPATDVDWVHAKFIFYIVPGN